MPHLPARLLAAWTGAVGVAPTAVARAGRQQPAGTGRETTGATVTLETPPSFLNYRRGGLNIRQIWGERESAMFSRRGLQGELRSWPSFARGSLSKRIKMALWFMALIYEKLAPNAPSLPDLASSAGSNCRDGVGAAFESVHQDFYQIMSWC